MTGLFNSVHLWIFGVVAMICLAGASGFFSSSETALFYLSHEELRQFRIGKRRQRLVTRLLMEPDRLLTAILFWNLVINLTYFSISVILTQHLMENGHNTAVGIFAACSVLGIIVFGEVLPKSVAVGYRLQIASGFSWPLSIVVRLFDPFAPAFQQMTQLLRRAFWPHIARDPYLQIEDLEQEVENSQSSPEVVNQERQVLLNILDLSEMTVEEVMRPRGTYMTVASSVKPSDLEKDVFAMDYVAIVDGDCDDFERVIALDGLMPWRTERLAELAEEVVPVPWCARLAYTLQLMRDRFCSAAAIVNEFGETIGLVTYDDILDTFLSPQSSRAKRLLSREPVLEVAPNCYHVEGITSLRTLSKRLGVEFEPTVDGLVTVAGVLYDQLEHIPVVGDECLWHGFRMKVIDVSERGHVRVMMSKVED